MSDKVTVSVSVTRGRNGRRQLKSGGEAQQDETPPPPTERVPRVARMLALAHHWQGLIRDGVVEDRADVARLVGVSRARVSQVMRLLDLAPDIQEAVLDGEFHGNGVERALRNVAGRSVLWNAQRRLLADQVSPSPIP